MKIKAICASLLAVIGLLALPACTRDKNKGNTAGEGVMQEQTQTPSLPEEANPPEANEPGEVEIPVQPEIPAQPKIERVQYITPTADGVNIRAGAGTGYKSLGTAERNTLYALSGSSGGWIETRYKNGASYISAAYCSVVQMDKSENQAVERVIEEGCKYLGVPYVYGAVRYHDGYGNKLSGFTPSAFDCSSLMQYIFKTGAGVNLQVNTRTQIYQGKTVKGGGIERGDLLFFTNASRKNLSGIERVGHVALYLGDNYILHTASDYAKIEQISPARWGYFIQAQRIL